MNWVRRSLDLMQEWPTEATIWVMPDLESLPRGRGLRERKSESSGARFGEDGSREE